MAYLAARGKSKLPSHARHRVMVGATAALLLVPAALLLPAVREQLGQTDFGTRIINADKEPGNWLSTGRNYEETRFSSLDEINTTNVGSLQLAWSYDLDTNRGQESTPLAVDGVLYTTSAWSKVQAFDSATGKLLWQFDPEVPGNVAVKACCDVVNRGAAYWDGKIYVGTIDGRLIAINAKTGKQIWSVLTVDPKSNQTITGAPRIVKGRVIIGNGGAEFGARGYVTAYDVDTGAKVWRFYIVPGQPGRPDGEVSDKPLAEKASKTWAGQWWSPEHGGGGGGTVWDSMAYDPELDLLYIGTGNGSFWNKAYRSPGDGDNLFIASVLALRPETGEYVWHYQETPGDQWDYTSTQHMILTTLEIGGVKRKVLLHAPKNGYFYVLDRETGKVISAEPYIALNWSTGIDLTTGRPKIVPAARYDKSGKPWISMPGGMGGHNWEPMAFSPRTGLVYIPVHEIPGYYKNDPNFVRRPLGVNIGIDVSAVDLPQAPRAKAEALKVLKGYLLAWDPVRQKAVWRADNPGIANGGVLATAGGLVFQGDNDGMFNAYDAKSGKKLWRFDAQSAIIAAPITYSVNGTQYVSVLSGFGGPIALGGGEAAWSKDGPRRNISRVLTFRINGKAPALPLKPVTSLGVLAPPPQFGDAEAIKQGRLLYLNSCGNCHGSGATSTGVLPDLRYSGAITSREAFYSIVGEGLLSGQGMVSFAKNYSPAQIETIRAYVIDQAHKDTRTQRKAVK